MRAHASVAVNAARSDVIIAVPSVGQSNQVIAVSQLPIEHGHQQIIDALS